MGSHIGFQPLDKGHVLANAKSRRFLSHKKVTGTRQINTLVLC